MTNARQWGIIAGVIAVLGTGLDLALAIGGVICGALVIVYGRYFLRKLKAISYL